MMVIKRLWIVIGIACGIVPAAVATDVYDRVMASGTLRCGYVLYEPAVMKDPNTGKFSGFAYETVEKIAENLGLEVDWVEEVGTGVMLQGLETDRYDMVCTPFWRTAERAKIADFTTPLYYSPMGLWVRADDNRFRTARELNTSDATLSVMDGTTLSVIARDDFPKARTLAVPQLSPLSDLLLNVVNGKADAVPIDNYLAHDFLSHHPGALKNIAGEVPLRVYANGFPTKRGRYAFTKMVDIALLELLDNGWFDQTLTAYERYPNTFKRVQKNYQ